MSERWGKTRYPGVRYREHPERMNGRQKDRYFVIRYKRDGKTISEAVGWASHDMDAQRANLLRAEIIQNIREGEKPQSLAEKRRIQKERRKAEETRREAFAREQITFDELAQEFLEWAEANKKDYINDKGRYNIHIGPALGHMVAKEISPFILEKFKRDLQKKEIYTNKKRKPRKKRATLSPKTVHHCLTLIRSIFRKAMVWDLYNGEIPTDRIKFPKLDNKRIRFLSHDEADSLLEKVKNKSITVHDQSVLSLHCGLRFSEIAKLRWSNVNLDSNVIQIMDAKGGDGQVYIVEPVKEVFLRLKVQSKPKPGDFVFPTKQGIPQKHVSTTFYRTVRDLGLNEGIEDRRQKVCFHSLRHTFGSWLAIQGTSLYEIMELMRLKNFAMAQRYAHLSPNVKRKAVNQMAKIFSKSQKGKATEKENIIELYKTDR